MSTYYTYKVAPLSGESCSFEEFVWHCVNGFKNSASFYTSNDITRYRKHVIEFEQDLEHYKFASDQDLLDEIQLCNTEIIKMNIEYLENNEVTRNKYSKMLQKVRDWTIPDESFVLFKNFMIEQLILSLNDCIFTPMKTRVLDAELFRQSLIKISQGNLNYYQEQLRNAAKKDSKWIDALQKSVPPPTKRSNNDDRLPPF